MKIQSNRCKLSFSFFALLLAMLILFPLQTEAAAKPTFNPTKKTIYVGDSCTIKLLNNSKNVTWSTSNKNIKIVSKNQKQAKIKGVKKGTSYLTAKSGGKTYKCKITVKAKSKNKNTGKSNGISYELQDTKTGVVAILKNQNSYDVCMSAKVSFYANGKLLGSASDSNYAFEKGKSCALYFKAPSDSQRKPRPYDNYKITITSYKGTNLICASPKIKVTSKRENGQIRVTAKNNSGKKLSFIKIACVFYDAKGNAIGYDVRYANCLKKGTKSNLIHRFPYDTSYNLIQPKSYKLYVNCAYTYTWSK